MRLKTNELKDLQQELADHKQRSDEHIHDLSTKLKTVTDRHREATTLLNSDIKAKKQQIEQYTQQIEQIINEKVQFENERGELQRQVILVRRRFEPHYSVSLTIVSSEGQYQHRSGNSNPKSSTRTDRSQLSRSAHSTRGIHSAQDRLRQTRSRATIDTKTTRYHGDGSKDWCKSSEIHRSTRFNS